MRGRASFAAPKRPTLLALAVLSGLVAVPLSQPSLADDSVTLEILDHPGVGPAEVAVEEPEAAAVEEPEAVESPPQDLMIADAIKVELQKPSLQDGHNPDDVAALAGFYRTRTGPALWLTTAGISDRGKALVKAISSADEWGLDPTAFPVPPLDYEPSSAEDQAATELAISFAALTYARRSRGGLSDYKGAQAESGESSALVAPEELLKTLSTAAAPDAELLALHPKHKQFAMLRAALKDAKSEREDLVLRRNMDRWRSMPKNLGESYVWLNIPEFMLHVVDEGKIVESEKVIVGAKGSPTPVLSADMTEIVFNPERIVPAAVIRRDVLPKLRSAGSFFGGSGNTAILDQYGITVKRGGKTIDPKTIDWRKTNLSGLTFVQKPGRTNIMGKVQFLLPNDQNVFIRDTSLRGKFARDIRADGAKEPRVENADKLAERLLSASNNTDNATVRQQIARGETSRVKLQKAVPVHITYFTAVVGEDGELKTFGDIYELDDVPAPGQVGEGAEPSSEPRTGEPQQPDDAADQSLATINP